MRATPLPSLHALLLLAATAIPAPVEASHACAGDCNLDGIVQASELDGARAHLLDPEEAAPCAGADADGNGVVTVRDLVLGVTVQRGGCVVDLAISGRVAYDDGGPIVGADVVAQIMEPSSLQAARLQSLARAIEMNRDGKPVIAQVTSAASAQVAFLALVPTTTDAEGNFNVVLPQQLLPARVILDVSHQAPNQPRLDSARTIQAAVPAIDAGTISLPNPATAGIVLAAGAGATADDDVRVEDMPPEISKFQARAFDPSTQADAFPGDFTESDGLFELNSAQFTWMEAQDTAGNEVSELTTPAKIRGQIPPSQWMDLSDIMPGTDRIEVPIYTFNETFQMWEQMGIGWLEDDAGTILPEDAQDVVLNGTYQAGKLYATYQTMHFSWMNVDYPYIGPWKLGCLSRERRNNDCLYRALNLAKTILRSAKGRAAYAKVNLPDVDLDTEVPDDGGPSLKTEALDWTDDSQTNGEYGGDAAGGHEDRVALNEKIWDYCDQEGKKDDIVLLLASTILHESAHWKDDVKKHPGAGDTTAPDGPLDTRGEEGKQLEKDLFGGDLHFDPVDGRLEIDRVEATAEQKAAWLDPANWPATNPPPGVEAPVGVGDPLEITLEVAGSSFAVGESIMVTATYRNASAEPVRVLGLTLLEDYPIRFDIQRMGEMRDIGFLGPEADTGVTDADFVTLGPGEMLQRSFDLVRDEQGRLRRYSLRIPGEYVARAVYAPFFGLPEMTSDPIGFTITPGGSLGGLVLRADTAQPLPGATVRAYLAGTLVGSAVAGPDGTYVIENLPVGTYDVEARAPGYLRAVQTMVLIEAGTRTTVDFSLSQLLAAGVLQFVLTWAPTPRDLDSHTWLPADRPYHVYYSETGDLLQCPFAALDVDDTSGEGPETTTISQRIGLGTYTYAIYNYTGSPSLTESGARVLVRDQTGTIATIEVPTEGTGLWWKVLTVDSVTGSITEINEIVDDASPYPDSNIGCPPEVCDGQGGDEDEDELADCADPDCRYASLCIEDGAVECSDGEDNDGDGPIDCDDTDCNSASPCTEDGDVECGDGVDNDDDGLTDCRDTQDCYYSGPCQEGDFARCHDGLDNNENGATDCDDGSCFAPCYEPYYCADQLDNDGDGLVDCADWDDCRHQCPESRCSDGIDDDADGRIDCLDPDCFESPGCLEDGDGDGVRSDGNDSGVAGDARCTGGQAQGCDDNCPRVANGDQADADADGIGDACEEPLG